MKKFKAIIFASLFIALTYSPIVKAQSNTKEKLVGVWQASEAMGSGWSDTYRFFNDSKFIFHTNQMNCAAREISNSGTWKIENNGIVLMIKERVTMVGGKLVPVTGSCGSKYEPEGAKEKTVKNKTPVRKILSLGKFGKDDLDRWTVLFGKIRFWRYDTDPKKYP